MSPPALPCPVFKLDNWIGVQVPLGNRRRFANFAIPAKSLSSLRTSKLALRALWLLITFLVGVRAKRKKKKKPLHFRQRRNLLGSAYDWDPPVVVVVFCFFKRHILAFKRVRGPVFSVKLSPQFPTRVTDSLLWRKQMAPFQAGIEQNRNNRSCAKHKPTHTASPCGIQSRDNKALCIAGALSENT